ncbi:MAG: hypothetical protein ACEQSR_03570, partial [Candidatus Methylacidiphilales bacterium]
HAKFSLKSKGRKRKWDVVEDDVKKNEGAMVDKMKSMEVVDSEAEPLLGDYAFKMSRESPDSFC